MNEQEKYDWMVYVSCMTFNHAPYIVDAMNGFTMQETNFPFVCAVVDDASSDGEQEVIKEYLNEHFDLEDNNTVRHEETDDYILTFARHKTNLNCYFAVLFLKYNHYKKKNKGPYLAKWQEKSKYIAYCEGDDYWIEPLKLQKQVDFMEQNENIMVCYTNFNILYHTTGKIIKSVFDTLPYRYKHYNKIEEFIINTPYICPPSWLYRAKLSKRINYIKGSVDVSFEMFLSFMSMGDVYYMPITSVVYRYLKKSASHDTDPMKSLERRKKLLDMQKVLIDKYGCDKNLKSKCEERYIHKNLQFLVENDFQDEINKAKRIKTDYSTKEKMLFIVAKSSVLRYILCFVHRIHSRINGY